MAAKTYDHQAFMAAMDRQNKEFDALTNLAKRWVTLQNVAVVDDDYPRCRHEYEGALSTFVEALRTNDRKLVTAHSELIEAAKLFTPAAQDAVRALNAAGLACPSSIALAAEKARNALRAADAA